MSPMKLLVVAVACAALCVPAKGETLPKPPGAVRSRDEPPKPAPKTYAFRMKDAKWEVVFDEYAKLTGLKPLINAKPKGTFTFAPPDSGRRLTLAEITDSINHALLAQDHILIRRHMTFVVLSLDEKIDPTIVARIALSELSERGCTELVQVIIPVTGMVVADAIDGVKSLHLLSPFGSAVEVKNFLLVTDVAGNVTRICNALRGSDE